MYVSINLSPFLTLSMEKRIHLFPGNVTFTSFILKERENICPTEKSLTSLFEPTSQYLNRCMGLLEIYVRTCLHC